MCSSEGLIERVVDEVRAFAKEVQQGDDMTCGVLGVERDPILDAVAIDREERIRLHAGGALDK